MMPAELAPAPIDRMKAGEEVIISHCIKCGNEIKIAVGNMTREEIDAAIAKLDKNIGECPGGYHVEFGGWRRLWDLDRAIAEHYAKQEVLV